MSCGTFFNCQYWIARSHIKIIFKLSVSHFVVFWFLNREYYIVNIFGLAGSVQESIAGSAAPKCSKQRWFREITSFLYAETKYCP